jgi:hypothetical protein
MIIWFFYVNFLSKILEICVDIVKSNYIFTSISLYPPPDIIDYIPYPKVSFIIK